MGYEYGDQGEYILLSGNLFHGTLNFFRLKLHIGWKCQKRYSCSFHPILDKCFEDIGYHGEYRLLFLAIG